MGKSTTKIERGIPIPETRGCRSIKHPFKGMRVGDSFVGRANNRQSFYSSAKLQGMKCAARKMTDGTYRVWRTA